MIDEAREHTVEDISEDSNLQEPPQESLGSQDLAATVADLKDQLLRALADAENIRKRSLKEKEDALKYGVTNFARELLTVSDTFERALSALHNKDIPEEMKGFVEGIQMTQSQLNNTFSKFGIQTIDALNQPFDSALHQAVFEIDSETVAAGHVAQVVQTGYKIHDRLLRPAMVGVVKASSGS